jgi:hypothetical protein
LDHVELIGALLMWAALGIIAALGVRRILRTPSTRTEFRSEFPAAAEIGSPPS